jgi:type VI secretion system protein ImpI
MPTALVVRVFDTQANQSFERTFDRFPLRIGRNQLNDLHIDRPYVSQFHAAIDIQDRKILVKDLGSTNGTMWNKQRLARDAVVDVTGSPEIMMGPIVIRLGVIEAAAKKRDDKEGTLLDYEVGQAIAQWQKPKPIAPGAEDRYLQVVLPYIQSYRTAWAAVYRLIWEHLQLPQMTPEIRQSYLKRLGMENPQLALEPDFQKIAQYYGVDARTLSEPGPPQVALAALSELGRTLAPGNPPLEDMQNILGFARQLRDTMEVFLKCFVSLRDGYHEFEAEVLVKEKAAQADRVATAKNEKELGNVLLAPGAGGDTPRQLQNIFVDVMSHQVALMNGVMVGVKTLLDKLSPAAIESDLDKRGKKGGLFSSRYEELWRRFEVVHGDSREDKEIFSTIFGQKFAEEYRAATGEDDKSPGDAGGKSRFTISPNQTKR